MDVGDGVDIMGGPGPLDGPPLGAGALMSLEGKQYDHELAPHSSTERFVLFSLSIDPLHYLHSLSLCRALFPLKLPSSNHAGSFSPDSKTH